MAISLAYDSYSVYTTFARKIKSAKRKKSTERQYNYLTMQI